MSKALNIALIKAPLTAVAVGLCVLFPPVFCSHLRSFTSLPLEPETVKRWRIIMDAEVPYHLPPTSIAFLQGQPNRPLLFAVLIRHPWYLDLIFQTLSFTSESIQLQYIYFLHKLLAKLGCHFCWPGCSCRLHCPMDFCMCRAVYIHICIFILTYGLC